MGMRVFQQKEPKMPGAHKIGAAIFGPRITGGNFMDTTLFLTPGFFECLLLLKPRHLV